LGDEDAMGLALRQARRGEGRCHPNPAVGAVVFRGARVLGLGTTRPPGGSHAEIVALERARKRHGARALRGATLAVTLEPCCHTGRTGPCTEAILAAGIARVLVGHRDPHPEVSGGGVRWLRRHGVEVTLPVLQEECRYQHRGFFSVVERGRPFVALKLAATLDGRNATAGGESRWITGDPARAHVHRLRDRSDAVMVGSGTARADDPSLTVRRGARQLRAPIRLLVDSQLRVSPRAKLFCDDNASRTWLLTGRGHGARRLHARTRGGARALELPRRGDHLQLGAVLSRLAREGINTVLVEGGAGLAGALLRRRLVDEVHWYLAPGLLGADARPAIGELGVRALEKQTAIAVRRVRRLGQDLYVHGSIHPTGSGAGGTRR
jgi:diaminohydroxyphosphoribosylaminopyrimidine deaminase/5-amino-6-(5-phosphoribosylamino)uracil reductase